MQETNSGATYSVLEPRTGGYVFTWNIEYLSGVVKKGGWNCDANDFHMQAWRQPGENILRAYITAMDKNRVKCKVVECPGPDFFSFEWIYRGRVGGFGTVQSRVAGLALLTETERVSVYESGTAVVSPLDSKLLNKYPQGR